MQTPKLYKIDSTGRTRIWWIEYYSDRYRTHSGLDGGKIVVSGWQYPEEKNVGRVNATSVPEQVRLEVEAEFTKKQNQGKYHTTINGACQGAKFHECMLAGKFEPKKHTNYPYCVQPKLDGIRCIISKDGMQSRQGKPIVSAPHILEMLTDFFDANPDVILDGELYNHSLKNDFEQLVSLARKTKPNEDDLAESRKTIQYHVYDMLSDEKFFDRFAYIESELRPYHPMIQVVSTNRVDDFEEVQSYLGACLQQGYEGAMLRDPQGYYEGKRSKNLLKYKEFEDAEFSIVSIIEGKGNWAGYAKAVEIRLPDGTTQQSGVRGSQQMLADVLANADDYIGTDVTVRYQNKTADDKLRFPVVVAFWKGKRDL